MNSYARTSRHSVSSILVASFLLTALIPISARSEVGVTSNEILLGTTTNLKGQTIGIAEEFNSGISAYIEKINRSGGIHGRRIRRIIRNDNYEPEQTRVQTLDLITNQKVFALIGYASSPGMNAILPLVKEKKIPVIAPYAGAAFLRNANEKQIFNIKAGYSEQVEPLLKLAVYSMGLRNVCAFYQDDALGQSAVPMAETVLAKYGQKLHARGEYQRNSMDIDDALKKLKSADCKVILMASKDREAKAFIKAAHALDFHPVYLSLNNIGTADFIEGVESLKEKIYVAAVTPLPSEKAYPIVKEFLKEASTLNPRARVTTTTLEGYLVGAILEHVLVTTGKNLTRKRFVDTFENLKDAEIGGLKFTFNSANRQATNRVLITKIEDGELALLP